MLRAGWHSFVAGPLSFPLGSAAFVCALTFGPVTGGNAELYARDAATAISASGSNFVPAIGDSLAQGTVRAADLPVEILKSHLLLETRQRAFEHEISGFARLPDESSRESRMVEERLVEVERALDRAVETRQPLLKTGPSGLPILAAGSPRLSGAAPIAFALVHPGAARFMPLRQTPGSSGRPAASAPPRALFYYSIRNGYIPGERLTDSNGAPSPVVQYPAPCRVSSRGATESRREQPI